MNKYCYLTLLSAILCLVSQPMMAEGEYQLVWNQDFTGSNHAWNIETNGDGGGNNELQYYCDRGVSLGVEPTTGKHCLILTATKESYKGKGCTSGRVNTSGKMNFTYGKIEGRILFPKTANGLWPAFWMLGQNFNSVGWPRCGETDFIELGHQNGFRNNTQERYFNGAMHVGSAWNTVWGDAQAWTCPYSVEDTFHIITVEWTPTSVTMWVDRESHPELGPYFTAPLEPNTDPNYNRQLVWSKPNFLILNLAVGGNFPGIYDVKQVTALNGGSAKMYIDWVRVYQRGDVGESFHSTIESEMIEPEPEGQMDVTTVTNSNPEYSKVICNGQLLLRQGKTTYNATGVRL